MGAGGFSHFFLDEGDKYRVLMEERCHRSEVEAAAVHEVLKRHNQGGGALLDLCCGIGSHSVAFAERGYTVTGVDFSPHYIERACSLAEERGVTGSASFVISDMRRIEEALTDQRGRLNAVVSLANSLGFFDDATDLDVFRQLHRLAASGCVFVLDASNRDYAAIRGADNSFSRQGEDRLQLLKTRFDAEGSRLVHQFAWYRIQENGDLTFEAESETSGRLYSLHELRRMLAAAGWRCMECYGGFDLRPYQPGSQRLMIVSEKN